MIFIEFEMNMVDKDKFLCADDYWSLGCTCSKMYLHLGYIGISCITNLGEHLNYKFFP